jgi:hypothetical protein
LLRQSGYQGEEVLCEVTQVDLLASASYVLASASYVLSGSGASRDAERPREVLMLATSACRQAPNRPRLVSGTFPTDWKPVARATGFFVDLLELTSAKDVEGAVVEPMLRLLGGSDPWGTETPRGVWTLEYGKV